MGDARPSMRLSEVERRALLKAISTKAAANPQAAKRAHTRYALPPGFTVVGEIQQPGGSITRLVVSVRDVSRGGMAMLYPCYLHEKTRCTFTICDDRRCPIASIEGVVVRCTFITGSIHDVGVKFLQALPVESLLRITTTPEPSEKAPLMYPALMALCDELQQLCRSGSAIEIIRQLVQEMSDALERDAKLAMKPTPEPAQAGTSSSAPASAPPAVAPAAKPAAA